MPRPNPPSHLTGSALQKWFQANNWSQQDQTSFLTERIGGGGVGGDPTSQGDLDYPWLKKPITIGGSPVSPKSGQPDYGARTDRPTKGGGSGWTPRGEPHAGGLATGDGGGAGGGGRSVAGGGLAAQSTPGLEPQYDETGKIIGYGDANLKSFQDTYQHLRDLEPENKFKFDDSYAPDSEGHRDLGGYLMDAGKVALGAFGATEKLTEYTPSSDFQTMINESRDRRNLGISQEARSQMESRMGRGYKEDVTNIRKMSGGSGGVALANLGGASQRFYGAQNDLNALDESLKQANRGQFYQGAMAGEQVNRQIFTDKHQIELMNKQAAGALMGDAMENIRQRKEYEDTYMDPDSPYYQYRKELTLDTRLNRVLKEEAEKHRVSEADKFLLDVENQMQEKIEGIETAKSSIKEDFNAQLEKEGKAPIIESSDDFNNYSGEPVVNIEESIDSSLAIPGVGSTIANNPFMQEQLGFDSAQLDDMEEMELTDKGIERQTHTVIMKDKAGNSLPPITYNTYGISTPMDKGPAPSMNDEDFLGIEDQVNAEYSLQEKELLDKYYLSNERKYNKLMAELGKQKKADLKTRQDSYLK